MFEGLGLAVALRVCVCVLSLIKFPVNCGESCIELLLIWAELFLDTLHMLQGVSEVILSITRLQLIAA